jgi:hypothetical protein
MPTLTVIFGVAPGGLAAALPEGSPPPAARGFGRGVGSPWPFLTDSGGSDRRLACRRGTAQVLPCRKG